MRVRREGRERRGDMGGELGEEDCIRRVTVR